MASAGTKTSLKRSLKIMPTEPELKQSKLVALQTSAGIWKNGDLLTIVDQYHSATKVPMFSIPDIRFIKYVNRSNILMCIGAVEINDVESNLRSSNYAVVIDDKASIGLIFERYVKLLGR